MSLTWHGIRSLIILAPEQNMVSQLAQHGDTGYNMRVCFGSYTASGLDTLASWRLLASFWESRFSAFSRIPEVRC